MIFFIIVLVGFICFMLGLWGGQLVACVDLDENELKKITNKCLTLWLQALLTDDEAIVSLYAATSTLHPTFCSELRKGLSRLSDYFKHFKKKNPVGHIIGEDVKGIGAVGIAHDGHYNFKIINPDGVEETVEARFSFVYKLILNRRWERIAHFLKKLCFFNLLYLIGVYKIIHHHSSQKPE